MLNIFLSSNTYILRNSECVLQQKWLNIEKKLHFVKMDSNFCSWHFTQLFSMFGTSKTYYSGFLGFYITWELLFNKQMFGVNHMASISDRKLISKTYFWQVKKAIKISQAANYTILSEMVKMCFIMNLIFVILCKFGYFAFIFLLKNKIK